MCAEKKVKPGLELSFMGTGVATHKHGLHYRKQSECEAINIVILSTAVIKYNDLMFNLTPGNRL